MVTRKVNKILGGLAIGSTILFAPKIALSQERLPLGTTIKQVNDSIYINSPKELSNKYDTFKIAEKNGAFLYGMRTSECEFTYNPEIEGKHTKENAKYWNETWKNRNKLIDNQEKKISELENKLKEVK